MSAPDSIEGNWYNYTAWMIYLIQKDSITGSQDIIEVVHQEIHDGYHYTTCVFDGDVDIGAPKYVRITAPDSATRIHLIIDVSADGGFLFEFYENPTVNAAGSALAEHNNDRNSGNAATATTFEDTTVTDDGTLLCGGYSGGEKRKATAEAGSRLEWILKQAEDYNVKVTPDADNTKVMIIYAWYEV